MPQNPIINFYKQQIELADRKVSNYSKLVNTYSFLRLAVIVAAIFMIYKCVQAENVLLTEISILAVIVAFAFLVSKQAKFEKEKSFYSDLKRVNENEIESLVSHKNIYCDGSVFIDEAHVYTSDLDIFGKGSLYNLLNRCATVYGNLKLSAWLKQKAETSEIIQRQSAIKELGGKKEWLLDLKARLLFAKADKENEVAKIFQYLKTPLESFHPFLKQYTRFSPLLIFAFATAGYFNLVFISIAIIIGLANMAVVFSNGLKVNKADRLVGKAGKILDNYADAFQLIEEEDFSSDYLKSLSVKASKEKIFHKKLKELSVLAGKLEYRLNIFVGPILNFLFAWDVRQVIAIERWKKENFEIVERAFDDLAKLESLLSLAGLHINYPKWNFPVISENNAYTYSAKEIGHPLINEDKRVLNDFELSDDFRIDIITGSNMAGKSTFLRTLGINAVLALAGAPVCAQRITISNMLIFTYMRIKDSLNESTSTFKAELNRLKLLLTTLESNTKVYFMIDEMLRGTNSIDKYLGSKAVIERLISQKAVGVVATHDLQIAKLEEKYPDYVRNFYFDIQIKDNEMLFDYKIKAGECKTFNASILLRQLGIRFEAEEI